MVKRVLVTGGSGFVGRACLARLAERGYEVHGVARTAPSWAPETQWHRCDLFDAVGVAALLAEVRPTHLLHLAWVTEPERYRRSGENFGWVRASLGLVEAFGRNGGKRVVAAGSCAEYDLLHGICSESATPLAPATPYGVCKHALQLMLSSAAELSDFSAAWGRLFFLYGPHEHPARLVSSVTRALLAGREAACTPGNQVRDYLHVDDAAAALVALLDSVATGPFNVASGRPVAVGDLALMVGESCGRPDLLRLGALRARSDEPPLIVGEIARIRTETGWEPRWGLREGVEATVRWWAEMLEAGTRSTSCG